jgi:hypothetical protein
VVTGSLPPEPPEESVAPLSAVPALPQRSPHPGDREHGGPIHAGRHQIAATALRSAAHRLAEEIDAADLTVAGGDVVQIVCLADVSEWLHGLAIRVEAGEPL